MATPVVSCKAMNLSAPALLSAAVIALLSACASTSVSPGAGTANPSRSAMPVNLPPGPEARLQRGMAIARVKQIMGAPAEITPLQTPSGTAEVWIYHRTSTGAVRQVQVGSRSIPVQTILQPDGSMRVVHAVEEPVFKDETENFDETIRLLIYDGAYLEQTHTVQRRLSFQ